MQYNWEPVILLKLVIHNIDIYWYRLNKTVIKEDLNQMSRKTPIKEFNEESLLLANENGLSEGQQLASLRKKPWS